NILERPEFFDILVCMTLRSVNFRQQPFGFVDDQIPQRIMFAVGLMADQIRFPEVLGLDHNVTHASSSNNIRKLLFHLAKLIIMPPIDIRQIQANLSSILHRESLSESHQGLRPSDSRNNKRRYFSGTILLLPLRTNSRETP